MLAVLISAALVLAQAEATQPIQSGPCSVELAQIERHVAQSKSNPLEGPTASQTVGAQLHHQPMSAAVKSAERKANADFQKALAQAREANVRGDAAACARAVSRARELYGVQ
jgi:hypothetical protein